MTTFDLSLTSILAKVIQCAVAALLLLGAPWVGFGSDGVDTASHDDLAAR